MEIKEKINPYAYNKEQIKRVRGRQRKRIVRLLEEGNIVFHREKRATVSRIVHSNLPLYVLDVGQEIEREVFNYDIRLHSLLNEMERLAPLEEWESEPLIESDIELILHDGTY
jgi:hypothetical protein